MKTNYVDILLYTAKMLKTNFPDYNIYVDNNEQEIIVPSFFVQVIPIQTTEGFDMMRNKMVNLSIEYVNRSSHNQDKLQVIDNLDELIGRAIVVAQEDKTLRALPVFNKKPKLTNSSTIMLVTLKYFDGHKNPANPEEPDRNYDDLMEILSLNIDTK
jgi:hypothetical protein